MAVAKAPVSPVQKLSKKPSKKAPSTPNVKAVKSPGQKQKQKLKIQKEPAAAPVVKAEKKQAPKPQSPGQKPKTPKKGLPTPSDKAEGQKLKTPKKETTSPGVKTEKSPAVDSAQKKKKQKRMKRRLVEKSQKLAIKSNPALKNKPAKKRSATEAGLEKPASEPKPKKAPVKSPIPSNFRPIAYWESHCNSEENRTVRFSNLPEELKNPAVTKQILGLLGKKEFAKYEFESSKRRIFRVVFNSLDDALAAKRLNGVLLGQKRLCVQRFDDKDRHEDRKVVVRNVPEGVTDEHIWETFESCGKIHSIIFRRRENECILTFSTGKAKQNALNAEAKLNNSPVVVEDWKISPQFKTVYLGLSKGAPVHLVKSFFEKVGPVQNVTTNSVEFQNRGDVLKAFSLDGQKLNGENVKLFVTASSYLLFKESGKGPQQVNVKAAEESEEDEEEDEEEGEDDDEEGEDEEDDDDDEEEEEEDDEEEDEDDDEEEDDDDDDEDDDDDDE
ncbi:hypothetical protein ONE63_003874 [Megalurothrips usitatus]|uniref:RRM domain-containing protein n=1 Tax=Megalurothrips usitatus TaxID=439358 RepID=A0AAV7X4D8_9NEOP|nr:hypothetical protein ONE63_003874 [Megalurothrips usitatus]